MKTALITGITGQDGSYLAEILLDKGYRVIGIVRRASTFNTMRIDHLFENYPTDRFDTVNGDMVDSHTLMNAIDKYEPDELYHMAAMSHVKVSFEEPVYTTDVIALGAARLYEAIRTINKDIRIYHASTSEMYGNTPPPHTELGPFQPLSPYAAAKMYAHNLGIIYRDSYGMYISNGILFNHSVSRWTPIIMRDDRCGLIDIRYISEIRKYKPDGYMGGKKLDDGSIVWDMSRHDMSVWGDGKWTKLIHISCHNMRSADPIRRIVSSGGIVEVTGDHSIMIPGENGNISVSSSSIKVGDYVTMVDLPSSNLMIMNNDIAWFLGFFAAEGCITSSKISISNKKILLLEKCYNILLTHFGIDSYIELSKNDVYRLIVRKPEKFAGWLYPQTYASDRNKKISMSILNSQDDTKLSFLRGYNAGDGLQTGNCNYEFKNFKTKSPILAMGLMYLISNTTNQRVCLNTELRNERVYYSINLNTSDSNTIGRGDHFKIPTNMVKKIENVDYCGEVWDFETTDHVFNAGPGMNLVHNTGPHRGETFVTRKITMAAARIKLGLQYILRMGHLDDSRDIGSAKEYCEAMYLMLQRDIPDDYVLGTGISTKVRDMVDIVFDYIGMPLEWVGSGIDEVGMYNGKVIVSIDPIYYRPNELPSLLGNHDKMYEIFGWRPTRSINDILIEMVDNDVELAGRRHGYGW